MARSKRRKAAEPWPPYDSPERLTYNDRVDLPEDYYRRAGRFFTPENFAAVRDALCPPKNFDLLKRLRRAVHTYWMIEAAQDHKLPLPELFRPRAKAESLEQCLNQLEAFRDYIENNLGHVLALLEGGAPEGRELTSALFNHVLAACAVGRKCVDGLKNRGGARKNKALLRYQSDLTAVWWQARKERMTCRTDPYSGLPYGPAFDFLTAGFALIGQNLSPQAINSRLKEIIRRFDIICNIKL